MTLTPATNWFDLASDAQREQIEELLALHRATFGDLRMEDDGGDGDGAGDDAGDESKDDDKSDDKAAAADKAQQALKTERQNRRDAEALLAEVTGKSKSEIGRLLKQGVGKAREALTDKPKGKDDEDKPDPEAIRREADRDATEKANTRIVRAEVKALAADLFADPADAPLYVDVTKYDVGDDGEVDAEEIKADLKAVLKAKPHLAKGGGKPKPDKSQGAEGGKPDVKPGISRMRQAYESKAKT